MIKSIRLCLLSYLIYTMALWPVLADTASLLPNAVQQFFDNNGNPLTSGYVYTYDAGTSTLKTTWRDSAEVTPNTNPIRLDAGGKAIIYGSGTYRQVVKDRNGNLIWDAVTAPGGGGSTPTAVGDGNLVGTILPWSGLVAPNQYVFAYGQEISRTAYPEFYTAVTQQLNVICSAASNTLTGISDTSQVRIGSPVELPLCVVAGTTVVSKTSSTITLSNPSSVSINSVATFFPWGNGNGSTTFNVPDFRSYVMAGRSNMGGSSNGVLTTNYYTITKTISPEALGAVGGSQSHTQTISELAAHTVSGTTNPQDLALYYSFGTSGAGGQKVAKGDVTTNTFSTTISGNTFTSDSVGSSTPFSIVQPTITVNYIIKITPDTSTSIATGVYSIGGMTGVISCGSGILCTGNIISFNASTFAGGSTNDIQFNNGGNFAGSSNFTFVSPDNLTLGAAGITAKFDIYGSTSGKVRQQASAVAGTPTVTWGTNTGTPAVTASSPLNLSTTTGNISITGSALTKVDDTNVTLTLGGSPTTALISAASITVGWSGQLAVSRGGTGIGSGTSGGIPYFNSGTTMASSGVLGANQIVIGGGAGAAPSTFACATTTTVVHGGTPPTCSQIVNADITTNTISNDRLNTIAAATFKGNPTNATATPIDFTIGSLTQTVSPGATDWIPIYDNATGTLKKVNASSIASSSVAGVASLNALTGAVTITGSSGIVVNTGTTITITPDIATAANFEAGTANKLLDASVVFTTETTTTYGTTTAFDFNTFINSKVTLTGNITTMNCSNMKAGQAGTIAFIQDGTGSRTASFNTGTCSTTFKWAGQSVASFTFPTLSTSPNTVDILAYSCRTSSYCAAALSKGYNP